MSSNPSDPKSKKLDEKNLRIDRMKGSGPGGQNRNKRETGIRIVHEPTGIEVRSTERRSQTQNLQSAMERLDEKLTQHFHVPKRRKKTRKTRGSQERRLQAKRRDSHTKRQRSRRSDD